MIEVKWKRKLYYNTANGAYHISIPQEIATPLRTKGVEEVELWFDPKEQVIKIKPVEKEA